jgi:soluble lytic murein transglycosylase-like protein
LQSLDGGAQYLHWLLQRFEGRTDLALAAYNAGEGAVDRHGGRIPPYGETLRYVNGVLERAIAERGSQDEASPR